MRRYELLCEALKRINGYVGLRVYLSNDEDDYWIFANFKCENWDCVNNPADREKFRLAMKDAYYDEFPNDPYFGNPDNWESFLFRRVVLTTTWTTKTDNAVNWSVSIC